jgi:ribonuclease P protein component
VLPAAARLTRSEDFRQVTRNGRRAGGPRIVVHAVTVPPRELVQTMAGPRVGFVVSRAVGNSVVRHRVARRLRHVLRDRLGTLPAGTSLIVRALPSAAGASSAEFGQDVDAALRRLRLTGDGGYHGDYHTGIHAGSSAGDHAGDDHGGGV